MSLRGRIVLALSVALLGGACARGGPTPLPVPAPLSGLLALRIVYPRPAGGIATVARAGEAHEERTDSSYVLTAHDSSFVFGSAGRGDAIVTVNGQRVDVYSTGGWIAWLPLDGDSVQRFDVVATAGGDTARYSLVAPRRPRFVAPLWGAWIDTTAWAPTGDRWVRPREGLPFTVRATPGAEVRLVTASDTMWFLAQADRYVAWRVGSVGPDPGPVTTPAGAPALDDSAWARLEVIAGADTARQRWPLRLGTVDPMHPTLVVVNDDTAHTGTTDSTLAGRPAPNATYHWFFPTGTVAAVSGRWNDQVRLQLSGESVAWVDARDVQPLPDGTPPVRGVARASRLTTSPRSVTLRVPLPAKIPFRVDETERTLAITLYGVAADMDWIRYGGTDPFVREIAFSQPLADQTIVTMRLSDPVWGYRTRWDGNDLLLEVRRPPAIDRAHPLRGRRIALDPGHPPGGAIGPTGVREPDVVLAVALKAKQLLEQRGAAVVLMRSSDSAVSLVERLAGAERADADVLVSVHANALPDGVNPFVNSGTSVYYFHPRSIPLARAMDRALVRQFGVGDLGMGRGDLALARPTWMPAVLLEGLFMMLPQQEAVLASDQGQWRYARGIVAGLQEFLRWRAAGAP